MSGLREKAVRIVKELRGAGFQAYWAGGSVRDLLMGQEPQDYDIATSALPEQIMKLYKKTIPIGLNFGVVKVLQGEDDFEVATFRSDGTYLDGRHPSEVRFSGEQEDAARRDFSINGMFYDPIKDVVIDYVGGQQDIKEGIIRAIGNPMERFSEDKLRLMRAIRFAARFRYGIEPQTAAAIRDLSPGILEVSAERIREELGKMLLGTDPAESIRLLHQMGLLKLILPEVALMDGVEQPPEYHPEGDVLTHTLIMLDLMIRPVEESPSISIELALAVLLHDIGKPPTFTIRDRIRFDNHCFVGMRMAIEIGQRLRMSNHQIDLIAELVRDHLKFKDVKEMRESTLRRFLRQPYFQEHLELHRVDCLSSHGDLSNWEFCLKKLKEIPPQVMRPPKVITGEDLIGLGYKPGPLFKEILTMIEDMQLEGKIKTKDEALALVKSGFPMNH